MQLTDRYVADELEPLSGSWQIGTGRDLRLDRPVVLAATKEAFAHRSQLDHWLGKRAPLSHPHVAPLLDCAEGGEWFVCVFEGVGATPGLPDLPLHRLFQACLRITDGAEELLRARVPFVFSAGQVLFDRGEPRLTGLPDLSGTILQDAENVGRLSQFFAHAIEWKFVAPREDEISSSGVWELAMRKLRGEGAPKPVTMVALRTILQALAVEADLRTERTDAGGTGGSSPGGAGGVGGAATGSAAVAQQGDGNDGIARSRQNSPGATVRMASVADRAVGRGQGRADATVRMDAVSDSAPGIPAAPVPEIELPSFVRAGQAAPSKLTDDEPYGQRELQEDQEQREVYDAKEWADEDDPKSGYGRRWMWGIGTLVLLGLFVAAMVLAGRPHVQASPAANGSGVAKGHSANGAGRLKPHGGGSGSSPAAGGGTTPPGGGSTGRPGSASTGHAGALSSVIGMTPPSAVSALLAQGYRAGQISVTAVTSGSGRGLVTAAKRTASGAAALTVSIAANQSLVPRIVGLTSVQAGDLLLADHFHYQYALQSHAGAQPGVVFAQQPSAYTVTAPWSTVTFAAAAHY